MEKNNPINLISIDLKALDSQKGLDLLHDLIYFKPGSKEADRKSEITKIDVNILAQYDDDSITNRLYFLGIDVLALNDKGKVVAKASPKCSLTQIDILALNAIKNIYHGRYAPATTINEEFDLRAFVNMMYLKTVFSEDTFTSEQIEKAFQGYVKLGLMSTYDLKNLIDTGTIPLTDEKVDIPDRYLGIRDFTAKGLKSILNYLEAMDAIDNYSIKPGTLSISNSACISYVDDRAEDLFKWLREACIFGYTTGNRPEYDAISALGITIPEPSQTAMFQELFCDSEDLATEVKF